MFNSKRLIASSMFSLLIFVLAPGQENRAPIETPREPVASGPLVTSAPSAKRGLFVRHGTVVQLRLEVYNEMGQKLFDSELRGGNVLDWPLQDGAGQRLPSGSYACVLTSKSLSGHLSQRIGLGEGRDQKATIESVDAMKLNMVLQQTIGPVESNGALTILQSDQAEAITAITNNGIEGQVTSTAGPLTFRTGNIFSGSDIERMRITPEGNVGIGTDKPTATLDVVGTVRSQGGIRFEDGTMLTSASNSVGSRIDAKGDPIPSSAAAGTGTINLLAKWAETGGAGTLTNSTLFEAGGQLGVGTTTPNPNAVVHTDR